MAECQSRCIAPAQWRPKMGGHASKSCTFSESAGSTPPPTPDLIVSGFGVPNSDGNYFKNGTYNSHDLYKHENGTFFIYFMSGYELWFMSEILGNEDDGWVNPEPTAPIGLYQPTGSYAGYPIATLP